VIPHASYQLFRAGRQLTPFEQREADAQIGRWSKWLSDTLTRLRSPASRSSRARSSGSTSSVVDARVLRPTDEFDRPAPSYVASRGR
jgi:hypothetical protein